MRTKYNLLEKYLQNREAPARGEDPQFDREVDAGVAWFMNLANAAAQDETVAAADQSADKVVAFTRRPRPVQTFSLMAAGSAEERPWYDNSIKLPGYQLMVSPLKSDETIAVIEIEAIAGEEDQFDALFGQDQGELIPISMYWRDILLFRGQLFISDDERSGTGKGTIYRRICSFSEQFSIRFDPLD